MGNEDLKVLFSKEAKLNTNEKKQRDLYLRQLALGGLYGPNTGYPQIDKPWLKYYTEDAIMADLPNMSMYDFLRINDEQNLDKIALNYLDKKYTYKELFEKIDTYAKALINLGVKKGDVVAIAMPSTAESIFLFYALNKIGAVSNLIDIRKSEKDIEYCVNSSNSKFAFIFDGILDKVLSKNVDLCVEKIIPLSLFESSKKLLKPIYKTISQMKNCTKVMKREKILNFKEFITGSKNVTNIPEYEYDSNALGFIEYTSGSTGFPKIVNLTNGSANARVFQYMNGGMQYKTGDKYLDIIPIFIAFGSVVGIHLPLTLGMEDIVIPAYSIKNTTKLLKKYKPNHQTFTPASYINLVHSKSIDKIDLSSIQTNGCGGDGTNATCEKIIDEKMKEHGCKTFMKNGYGGSEIGAPFSTQTDDAKKYGSVGIPLLGNNCVIFDHFTHEPLGYNQIGDICMCVEHPMIKYGNNDALTEKTKILLPNGQYGIMLGDAGYIDEDGFLYVKGRYDDIISKNEIDKEKFIYPVDVENMIMKSRVVKTCAVVKSCNSSQIVLYVVLEKNANKDDFTQYVQSVFHDILGFEKHMYSVVYKKELLYTNSGKIDRKQLKKLL